MVCGCDGWCVGRRGWCIGVLEEVLVDVGVYGLLSGESKWADRDES